MIMYRIKEIKIIGVTRLVVDVETVDIEAFRCECACAFKVRLGLVKFVYEEG